MALFLYHNFISVVSTCTSADVCGLSFDNSQLLAIVMLIMPLIFIDYLFVIL